MQPPAGHKSAVCDAGAEADVVRLLREHALRWRYKRTQLLLRAIDYGMVQLRERSDLGTSKRRVGTWWACNNYIAESHQVIDICS